MNIKANIERLKQEIGKYELALSILQSDLYLAERDIQNHVYESIEAADLVLYDLLEGMAYNACKGSGNCGDEEYTQDFLVGGLKFTALGKFEYDRFDKRFYVISDYEYSVKEKS